MQRDERNFKNPEKFEPERFDNPNEIIPFSFNPFGLGARFVFLWIYFFC